VLSAHLEDRFRDALGQGATEARSDSIQFAVDFTRMLARVVPEDATEGDLGAMREALEVRAELSADEVDLLITMAMAPENRADVGEDELRAFGSRFGGAEEQALRMAVAEELDLHSFADRYGPAEALLLLDALFAVCAVDGQIDGGEISRLQRAASELGIDPMLVGALFRKHDVRHAAGDFSFDLTTRTEWVIGRSTGADIQLPDPQVAMRHARLVRIDNGWRVVDLGSGRPTLLQGTAVSSGPMLPGDDLRVGPYRLTLDSAGTTLAVFGSTSFSSLSVMDLHRTIPTRQGDVVLLDGVEFTVFSGEVIALVGPSGAGKTTLLSAIAGIAPPDSGDVLLDRNDFHSLLQSDRTLVGNVPQEDVVHGELTVEESLFYAARLRFPRDVGAAAIQHEVDRVLSELDITNIRSSRIGSALRRGISGGQRKRVNLGQELLTRTTRVLFLDEPTSGLDPQTAQDIVSQVRQLADDGRIVFIVTHDVSPAIMALVDHLMVLAKGGRLAWFGPPDEACDWFGVRSADEIFARLPDRTPEAWKERYRDSGAFRKYVRTREHLLGLEGVTRQERERVRTRRSFTLQYLTLTRRYAQVKLRDWTGTGVLLAQAPILAIAMWIVFPHADIATMFMLVLSALWFGASASVRELISERAIWRREARGGVMLLPYMGSKVTVLGALVTLQCVMLTTIVWVALHMWDYGYSLIGLSGVAVGTGIVGMSMGLLVSALFSSSEAAVGTLPLLLIPQIAFGGLIVKLANMTTAAKVVAYTMITRFAFEAAIKTGDELSKPGHKGIGESSEGIQRWLFDLGFRTSGADDMGLSMLTLGGILGGFFVAMMAATTWLVHRSRKGD
jgi:ABC-type multidrug transport system ATPase subunit